MKYTIDKNLIDEFRDKINDNENFVFVTYKDVDGKNYWNLICSCMDWIDVAVSYLQDYDFDLKRINLMSMQVYTYISSIDIIHESVRQLHRAIIRDDKIPFKDIKKIFKNNNICNDDNDYFKQVRAAFGAHPVNLKDNNGKWFASWPSNYSFGNEYDFELILYGSEVKNEDIIFGLRFDELNIFLQERYSYLNILMTEVDKQFEFYKNKLVNEPIERSIYIPRQLEILEIESIKRLNNDYYKSTIDELITIYNHEIESIELLEMFNDYKEILKDLVSEIHKNLQNIDLVDLEFDSILNPDYPSELTYPITKMFSSHFNPYNEPLFNSFVKKLNEHTFGKYDFKINESPDELFVKLKLMLYFK